MCWGDFLGLIVLVEESALACNRKQNIFLLGGFNLGGSGGGGLLGTHTSYAKGFAFGVNF